MFTLFMVLVALTTQTCPSLYLRVLGQQLWFVRLTVG
jgi:hypothetical protein